LLVFLVILFPRSRSSYMHFILVFTMLLDLLKFNFTSLTSYVIVLFNRIDIQFRLLLTFTSIIWQYHTTLQLTSLYLDINFTSLFHLITVIALTLSLPLSYSLPRIRNNVLVFFLLMSLVFNITKSNVKHLYFVIPQFTVTVDNTPFQYSNNFTIITTYNNNKGWWLNSTLPSTWTQQHMTTSNLLRQHQQ